MKTWTLLVAIVPLTVAFAEDTDPTAAPVAALKASLGNPVGLEVGEVRVTSAGVTCIEYSMSRVQGGKSPGHAVVQGNQVLRSDSDARRFEQAWSEHCLGPRGGTQPSE